MNALDWLLPGRSRSAKLMEGIQTATASAASQAEMSRFSRRESALWQMFCSGAGEVVCQLLVKNQDRRLDWGVRSRRRKVDGYRLMTIYWWMLLYHLVLYRHQGFDGHDPQDDLPLFREAAQAFLQRELDPLPIEHGPSPWTERWDRQFALESAMGIYDNVHGLLGLHVDLTKRINRVSLFTTATEQEFGKAIKQLEVGGR
ncbi:MAG: hypothetical protein CL694_02975 [Chloroflexi bacterium]|nr:hypothetical protein [Chloroflexota bacterium]